MKTLEQQIAVMQHFAAGGEVECKNQEGSNWGRIQYPGWDWLCFDYRIKEQTPKKSHVKLLAWFRSHDGFFTWRAENHPMNKIHWKRVPSEDKTIEVEV